MPTSGDLPEEAWPGLERVPDICRNTDPWTLVAPEEVDRSELKQCDEHGHAIILPR